MAPRPGRASAERALLLLVISGTLAACGVGMLLAAFAGALGDGRELLSLIEPGLVAVALGGIGLVTISRPTTGIVRPTAGFAAVALAWVVAASAGSIPLLIAGSFSSPVDAMFEAMSGFTTTGATLLDDIEAQPDGILLWRSITQWLGGIGIVVLVVAVAPRARIGLQRLFYAEVTGITADRLTPRITDTAKIIIAIYGTLSLAAAVAYGLAGMSVFDAINHAMTTLATGGFSTRNASIASFDSIAIELIAISFMLLAAINFALYWRVVRRRRASLQIGEAIVFLTIVATAVAVIGVSLELAGDASSFARGVRDSLFSVVTVATTTGYTTADFDDWNELARLLLLGLMLVGGCAGSTAGGLKVIRATLLAKTAGHEVGRQAQPTRVRVLRFGGRVFPEDVRSALLGFVLVYTLVFGIGCIAFAIGGLGPATSLGATAATLNNIGPGLGEVGAVDNYTALASGDRVVAMVLMLAGRLEIFTLFALLAAAIGAVARRT